MILALKVPRFDNAVAVGLAALCLWVAARVFVRENA